MKILTGNDLVTGDVVWWTGDGWSRLVADAVDVADAGEAIAKREEAARRVNVPYLLDAALGETGPVPLHIKDRIRAAGPTVRPDLGVQAEQVARESWVI
ncbi:DUF2849 domain-containing protein [uncultured Sphingomonas sp.]|uniref:DUF2849 domain-containing protein n=1 Tax=uncultured Sphingomonas sp. TaxID=158754 RepID=UPI0025E539CC|nr:DUF2849 domain-containing protein [uncultured Sphingomonas sp.]